MVHLICQSQTTSTGDTKNLSEAVIGTRLVYGRTADSLAVVEAENIIEADARLVRRAGGT